MNQKNDNLPFDDSASQLDKNISRLVKVADDSSEPNKTFTNSLIDGALSALRSADIRSKREQEYTVVRIPWMNKIVGWAAMFTAACCAGLAVIVSILLNIYTFFGVIVFVTMFSNWLIYLGGFIS